MGNPSHTNLTTIRLTPSGALDITFNSTGILIYDYGYTSKLVSVFTTSNEIIVAGSSNNTTFTIAKYFQ